MASNKTPGNANADDVAAIAGVSRWTVNRAFRDNSSISEKTRQKVYAAATQLGYAPNLLAASLASDKSNLVSLLVDDFANPHKLYMMERMTRVLRQNGWETLLVNTVDNDDASRALLNASQRQVDAAVLLGSQFNDTLLGTELGARRVRKLIVFGRRSVEPNAISIRCDDKIAMQAITDHVIKAGYQRPLFLAGPQSPTAHLLRKETFLSRWLEVKDKTAESTPVLAYDPKVAYSHITHYLHTLDRSAWPDILVCENDALATGAIDAVRYEFGLRIPEDIAVTGFDDAPIASNPNYQLTTYRQPIPAMVEALVEVLKGNAESSDIIILDGELVLRETA